MMKRSLPALALALLLGACGDQTLYAKLDERQEDLLRQGYGLAPAVAAYVELARQNGLTPTQLALGFVRSRWFVSSTIIGASSLAQLHETLPATLTPLSAEILNAIDDIHLRYTNPAP